MRSSYLLPSASIAAFRLQVAVNLQVGMAMPR
jgi:hypothetical protein